MVDTGRRDLGPEIWGPRFQLCTIKNSTTTQVLALFLKKRMYLKKSTACHGVMEQDVLCTIPVYTACENPILYGHDTARGYNTAPPVNLYRY